MAIFFSIVLIFVGGIFSFVGFNIAIMRQYHSFISNFDRNKLRYKNAEAHAQRMGWIDLIVGVTMVVLGVISLIVRSDTLGMYFLCGSVVALFAGLITNDNIGLK